MKYLIIISLILFGCGKPDQSKQVADKPSTTDTKPLPDNDPIPDPDPEPDTDPIPDPKPEPAKAEHFYKLCMDEAYIGEGRYTIDVIMQEYELNTCLGAARWLKKTDELRLYGKDIISLEPIKEITNLIYLDLRMNQIEDISDLEKLTGITGLIMDNNLVQNISVLSNFKNLQTLMFKDNPLNNIEALCSINNIDWMDLRNDYANRNRKVKGIGCVGNHKKLTLFYISNLVIDELNFVNELTELEYLLINGSNIKNMDFFKKNIPNLKNLSLHDNDLINISNIDLFPNLENISIWFNKITNISPLHKLKNLDSWSIDYYEVPKNEINCPKYTELPKPIKEFCFGETNQDI